MIILKDYILYLSDLTDFVEMPLVKIFFPWSFKGKTESMCEVPEIVTISIDSRSVSDTTLRQTLHLTTYVSQIMMIVGCHNVHIGQQCETYKENMTYRNCSHR